MLTFRQPGDANAIGRVIHEATVIPPLARPVLTGEHDVSCYSAQKLQQEPKRRIH